MKIIHRVLAVILAGVMLVSLAACGASQKEEPQTEQTNDTAAQTEQTAQQEDTQTTTVSYPVTVTDMAGREVTITAQPEKIVSGYYISSSACIALGLADKIVGIEDKSQKRPVYQLAAPELVNLPNVGSAKAFDLETCLSTNPDLVILPMKQKDMADTLQDMDINAIVVSPESHEELVEMITLIGTVTNTMEKANALIAYYSTALEKVEKLTADLAETDKPTVYMAGPSSYLNTSPKQMYQSSLIQAAGGVNAGDELEGNSWAEVSYEQLLAMNPDIIVIPTNNFATDAPDYKVEDVLGDSNLSAITAVKNKAVYQMPVGYEAWDSPVPSGILGTLWMLTTLHPDLYSQEEFNQDVSDFYQTFYGFDAKISQSTESAA